jgi:class 3 adenylate cyclase
MGIHLGDVLVEGDDLVGDGVNIAARLEQTATPGGVCISRAAYENVQGRLEARLIDLGEMALKNIARPSTSTPSAPARAGRTTSRRRPLRRGARLRDYRWSCFPSPISAAARSRNISSTGSPIA